MTKKCCPRRGLIVDKDFFAEKGGRQLTSIRWKERERETEREREKENERKRERESERAERERKERERERERKGERKRKASETLETIPPFSARAYTNLTSASSLLSLTRNVLVECLSRNSLLSLTKSPC